MFTGKCEKFFLSPEIYLRDFNLKKKKNSGKKKH